MHKAGSHARNSQGNRGVLHSAYSLHADPAEGRKEGSEAYSCEQQEA